MFRTTTTMVSETLTFTDAEAFRTELRQYFDSVTYDAQKAAFLAAGKVINRTYNLIDSQTIELVIDWDVEASYNEFYAYAAAGISNMESNGFTRTVVSETI